MRIAINATILDSTPSGLGVYTASLIKEISKLHEDTLVYTSCRDGVSGLPEKTRRVTEFVQPSQGQSGDLIRIAWLQTVFPLRLLRDQAALLFCPVTEGVLLPFLPQVAVVHDLLPLRFPRLWPRWHHYFRHIAPMLLKQSRACIVVSESTRQDCLHFYGGDSNRIHVVYPGYDQNHYKSQIDTSAVVGKYNLKPYVLYVGNMLPHKNLHRLLNAFATVSKKISHQLVIAGKKDPRYYPDLEKETVNLGLEHRVLFLDYLPSNELPALYAGAECLALTSLYEGFGLPALEAMACGTPVIASNIGSLPEVTGDSAILVDPYSTSEIANAMETVLSRSDMREKIRQKGLERAKQFSWEQSAKKTLEILHSVARSINEPRSTA